MARAHESIRAFAAIELPDPIRAQIEMLVQRLKPELPNVSWTRVENIHLTLRFLGNVSPNFIEAYAERLTAITTDLQHIEATVECLGAFPSARKPSVVWIGMNDPASKIVWLQSEAERVARVLGLEAETREFVPHITLGRVPRRAPRIDATSVLDREREFSTGAMSVAAVSLFSSKLTPRGARYTRLHRLTFNGIRGESDL